MKGNLWFPETAQLLLGKNLKELDCARYSQRKIIISLFVLSLIHLPNHMLGESGFCEVGNQTRDLLWRRLHPRGGRRPQHRRT